LTFSTIAGGTPSGATSPTQGNASSGVSLLRHRRTSGTIGERDEPSWPMMADLPMPTAEFAAVISVK
jgi:hypothetical protein